MAIPSSAVRWDESMDPGDMRPFVMSFTPLLDVEVGEQIDPANWSLTMSPEGVALGAQIGSAGDRVPTLEEGGSAIKLWLSVAGGNQSSTVFKAGVEVAIVAQFRTTATPYSQIERTFVVRIVNK
jgi:hypothetical protein